MVINNESFAGGSLDRGAGYNDFKSSDALIPVAALLL